MPTKCCFLCASDEGVFLDITTENKQTFCTQFKICSLVKAPTSDQLPTKICHKCAYELNQCSTFLKKYKKAANQKNYNRKKCCSLCFEQTDKEYTFDLKKENTLQLKSIDKIQQILTDESDIVQENNILVCLSCRYTVDVLCDLKNLSNGIASKLDSKIEEDIDYSSFPKVKTTVISRKTTITESARATLIPRQNIDSDSDTMTRTRSKAKLSNKVSVKSGEQACKECHSPITVDSDAHKNEKTGQTVCKVCWEKSRLNAKDIEAQNPAETKVCKVFLEDVLSQTAAQKGKQKTIVLSSDTDSDTRKQAEKRSIRSANINDSDNKDVPNKKAKRSAKETVKEREPSLRTKRVSTRTTRSRKAIANNKHVIQSSDTDTSLSSNKVKRLKGPLTKHKKVTGSSLSDADVEIKRDRKRLKSILTRNSSTRGSDANDESSTDDGGSKKKKLRFKNDSPIYIDLTVMSEGNERPRRNAVKRSVSNAEKVTKLASVKKPPQKSEVEDKADSLIEEEIKTYSCEECGVNYENRLVFLTHKLTHCKQPRLELEKVTIESKPNAVSQDTKEAADEQSEDQLEAIRITVDDDEEEAELESSNLDSSADANLSTSSLVEKVAASPEKETPKDTVDTEIPSKELDNDQPTEKDDTDRKSLRDQRSRSLSTDKANAENVSELVEEENVEDISLTNIEDDQEEEEGEEEKEVGRESERKEKAQDGEVADSVDPIAGAVEEEKEAEKLDKEKPKETISDEKLGDDAGGVLSEDVDVDKLDSSQKIEADRTQGEAKLDSTDASEEKNDTALFEKSEENQVEEKERRNSSDAPEENLKDKEQLELSDKSEANLAEDKPDSSDKSEEVRLNEKDKTDSSDRSEERRVTRTNRSVSFATLEEEGKQDSRENSREKSSSPGKSEKRRSPRRSKSSPIARLEEDKRESSETPEETDKLGSPARSEERKSTRKTRSSMFAKIEEDKQDCPEKPEEKDKLGSPAKCVERKSPRKSKSGLIERIKEDKEESPEKPEEEDECGSPDESEEKKVTRSSKSNLFGKSEEKDKQDSSEKSKDKPVSSEKLDKDESEEKTTDKDESEEKTTEKDESEEKTTDKEDVIVEINDDDSLDSVKEVCQNECNSEVDADDAEEVQVVETNDNTSDVEEVCEQKDDDDSHDDEEVQFVETNCSEEPSDRKRNDAQRNGEDVVEVEVCTQPMPTSDSADVAAEIMQEVLDLASTEIQKRQDGGEIGGGNDSDDEETLENISREVQNGGDTRP
ncbi:uncharacterized protein LOC143353185 [Halictus rubicundus]|uniref:uncharacterized protein LOC143353185 n=1 Tax=Halictus rubicundus TaxID=77578 RepID=UPI0040374F33